MDKSGEAEPEELDFNFDECSWLDEIMQPNQNPATEPLELNNLSGDAVQSLPIIGNNCEVGDGDDLEFDLGNVDDSSSDDGGEVQNDAVEGDMASCENKVQNEVFSGTPIGGEQHTTMHEYWNIVNKTFVSEEEAFSFYNKYAEGKGFSVRKQKVRRAKHSRELLFRRFLCSRQGEREAKWLEKEVWSRRPRALTRCDCQAKLEVRLHKVSGIWYVHSFVDEHNHRLASADEVPFLWSHRKMKDFHKAEIMELEAIGIRKHIIMDVLQSRYGGYGKVGIVRKDAYNFSARYRRARIGKGDAMAVLGLMQSRQSTDPDFYYDYQLDDDGCLKTMFWCDSQSRMDYQSFGDVVVFDSTYRTNRYKMPFVPFVGMNHHRSTTVFGCGIVSDERVESYVWMLRAFIKGMCQQKPQSIITDGDYAMMKAIREVLPGVSHRICAWHVEQNLPKHLSKKAIEAFRHLIYNGTSPDTFEHRWNAFLVEHQSKRNSHWLRMMHRNKKLWAASFQFEKFFLGMRSNQRSESMNSCLHRHLDRQMRLFELVEHYENSVSRLRQTEAHLDCIDSQSLPVALTDYRQIEVACSHVFTATNFYKLQEEIARIDDFQVCETLVGMDSERLIVSRKEHKEGKKKSLYIVDYSYRNSEIKIKCTCRKMEREGLPCCHIFVLLDHLKFSTIPSCCIVRRHSKAANGGLPSRRESKILGLSEKRQRYNNLTVLGSEAFDFASSNHDEFCKVTDYLGGIISKKHMPEYNGTFQKAENQTYHFTKASVGDPLVVTNKGAPRKNSNGPTKQERDGNRIKSFNERRKIKCSICSKDNHNRRTCPWRDQAKHVAQAAPA